MAGEAIVRDELRVIEIEQGQSACPGKTVQLVCQDICLRAGMENLRPITAVPRES
jgi:hypothetical protein